MNIGNFIITVFILYYIGYIVSIIINKNKRVDIQKTNTRLEELRDKPFKTIEEQREFINLRYPKTVYNFSWLGIGKFLIRITIYIILFKLINNIFNYYNININLWHAITVILLVPVCVNFILKKFGVQKNDVSVFFRRKKR